MGFNLTLIGQVLTFLVFWLFVYKVIWPIFKRVAEERQKKIADGLSLADKAKVTMFEAQEQSSDAIAKAKAEANEILARANKQASSLIEKAKSDAQKAGELELDQAREQIKLETKKARDELKNSLSNLVVEGVEKIVQREINKSDHEKLISDLTEKL